MTITKAALTAAGLLLLSLPPMAAQASTITETVDFTARGSGGPVDPVIGSFTITYDPTLSYTNETGSDITLNSLNIALDSPLSFTYNPGSYLQVGGRADTAIGISWGANDFALSLFPGVFNFLAYSQVGQSVAFYSSDITATYTPIAVATTPIPASLEMMGTALLALLSLGLMQRSAKRMVRAA